MPSREMIRQLVGGFYGIVDLPSAALPAQAEAQGSALLEGGCRILQLRMKHAGSRAVLACARALRTLTEQNRSLLCVNDRLDVALLARADVVHLGQDDLPLAEARRLAAGRLAIGISTHSEGQARQALEQGADYIAFGPVFATLSKEDPGSAKGVRRLREVVDLAKDVPVVALGGITVRNVGAVAAAGAAAVAAIAAVKHASDPVTMVRQITAHFAEAKRSTGIKAAGYSETSS